MDIESYEEWLSKRGYDTAHFVNGVDVRKNPDYLKKKYYEYKQRKEQKERERQFNNIFRPMVLVNKKTGETKVITPKDYFRSEKDYEEEYYKRVIEPGLKRTATAEVEFGTGKTTYSVITKGGETIIGQNGNKRIADAGEKIITRIEQRTPHYALPPRRITYTNEKGEKQTVDLSPHIDYIYMARTPDELRYNDPYMVEKAYKNIDPSKFNWQKVPANVPQTVWNFVKEVNNYSWIESKFGVGFSHSEPSNFAIPSTLYNTMHPMTLYSQEELYDKFMFTPKSTYAPEINTTRKGILLPDRFSVPDFALDVTYKITKDERTAKGVWNFFQTMGKTLSKKYPARAGEPPMYHSILVSYNEPFWYGDEWAIKDLSTFGGALTGMYVTNKAFDYMGNMIATANEPAIDVPIKSESNVRIIKGSKVSYGIAKTKMTSSSGEVEWSISEGIMVDRQRGGTSISLTRGKSRGLFDLDQNNFISASLSKNIGKGPLGPISESRSWTLTAIGDDLIGSSTFSKTTQISKNWAMSSGITYVGKPEIYTVGRRIGSNLPIPKGYNFFKYDYSFPSTAIIHLDKYQPNPLFNIKTGSSFTGTSNALIEQKLTLEDMEFATKLISSSIGNSPLLTAPPTIPNNDIISAGAGIMTIDLAISKVDKYITEGLSLREINLIGKKKGFRVSTTKQGLLQIQLTKPKIPKIKPITNVKPKVVSKVKVSDIISGSQKSKIELKIGVSSKTSSKSKSSIGSLLGTTEKSKVKSKVGVSSKLDSLLSLGSKIGSKSKSLSESKQRNKVKEIFEFKSDLALRRIISQKQDKKSSISSLLSSSSIFSFKIKEQTKTETRSSDDVNTPDIFSFDFSGGRKTKSRKPRIRLPFFRSESKKSNKKKFNLFGISRRKGYSPDFRSMAYNIYGKPPKRTISGFEDRPKIKRKRKSLISIF